MRTQIKQHSIAQVAGFFPGIFTLQRAIAIEMRLKRDDAAQAAVGDELLHGEVVAIPTAVVEGKQLHAFCIGE